jgi:hypothetical protein
MYANRHAGSGAIKPPPGRETERRLRVVRQTSAYFSDLILTAMKRFCPCGRAT